MPPIANLRLHAAAAAMIAAFAATSAAAQYLALGDSIPSASGNDRRDHLEILSYSWGSSEARLKPGTQLTVRVTKPQSTGRVTGLASNPSDASASGPASSNVVMKGSRVGQNSTAGHHGRGIDIATVDGQISPSADPNEKITVHGNRTESRTRPPELPVMATLVESNSSGGATGDPDRPIVVGSAPNASSTPPGKGSVWIRVATPWAGCRVGARYPSVELGGRGKTYVLRDVAVSSCGASAGTPELEEIALTYQKIELLH